MNLSPRSGTRSAGFALVEVIVACALLVAVASGTAQVVTMAVRATQAARTRTAATMLAAQKMEQLRSLAWRSEVVGSPPVWQAVSDTTTDLSADPPRDGGPGLASSPAGTLESNVPPYVDHLDGTGRWAGSGSSPPPDAVYTRRWSVRRLDSDPDNTVVLQVLVTTSRDTPRTQGASSAMAADALLVCVKTRRAE
jgi:type II secretory pathway pseudopilin PulG